MRHKPSETKEGEAARAGVGRTPQTNQLDYARLLGQVDLFKGLERVTLAKLAAHLEPLSYPSGTIIFHQAEPADAFYLVARKTVGVYVTAK